MLAQCNIISHLSKWSYIIMYESARIHQWPSGWVSDTVWERSDGYSDQLISAAVPHSIT